MSSPQAPPSHNWSTTRQGSSARGQTQPLCSTSGQAYIPEIFGPSQGHPRHNPPPPSDTPNNQIIKLLQTLTDRTLFLEQQLLAPQMRRVAAKNARNSVIRVSMDPEYATVLGTHGILDLCQRASHPFDLVIAVQRPQSAPKGEVLLIVRSDEQAEQIRNDKGQLREILGRASSFCPESFYITPSAFSKDDLNRMSTGEGAKHDYCEMFKDPSKCLEAWRNETGLDIKKACWKHGYLWLLLDSVDQAREAVSGTFYSLCGFQTQFMSRDPRSIPMQCFNCQDIGHMSNRCPRKVPCCGYCALEHKTDQCPTERMTKKCAICRGPHESYRLRECKHPKVIDALEKCRLWRGPAPWDKSAASRAQSSLFEGEHTNAASTGWSVDDTFPGHLAGWGDGFIDEPVHYNTASPWHPMSFPDRSFSPMDCRTTYLAPEITPHTSGNTRVPFNPAPGAPILRCPSPPASVTSSASRASLVECVESLQACSSISRRASKEILLGAVAQISCSAGRAQSPSPSNSESNHGWIVGSAELDLAPDNHLDTSSMAGSAELDLASDNHLDTSSTARPAELDLASDNRLDTSSTAGSMLTSPSHPPPDPAAQVDTRNTVGPKFTFACPVYNSSSSTARVASQIPAKRPARQDEHSSVRHRVKRVRRGREVLIPEPLVPGKAREEATRSGKNLDKVQSHALDKDSSMENANSYSEGNTRREDCHSEEPVAEDRGAPSVTPETVLHSQMSPEYQYSPLSSSATKGKDASMLPSTPQTASHGTNAEESGKILAFKDIPAANHRGSRVSVEATSRTSPSGAQHLETSHSVTQDATQLGNRPGSLILGGAAPGHSPTEALRSSIGATRSSVSPAEAAAITFETPRHTNTSTEGISSRTSFTPTTDSSQGARNSWTTPDTDTSSPTWTPATASSLSPTFRLTKGDEDEGSLPTSTSAASSVPQKGQLLLEPCRTQRSPDRGQKTGHGRRQDTQNTSWPQTQTDDRQMELLDESDPGDVIRDCITVKAPVEQTSLHAFFSPKSKPGVE